MSWIDVLHEGPVPPDLDLKKLRTVRAQFIASCGWTSVDEAVGLFSRRDQMLADSLSQDEVVVGSSTTSMTSSSFCKSWTGLRTRIWDERSSL